jgi:uncharacterized membrane protein
MSLLDKIMHLLTLISSVISVVSVCVVIYATLIAFVSFLKNELARVTKRKFTIHQVRVLRADLGTYLLLGLELLIASDIIKTIIEPGVQELMILGGVVILRTVLSFFLDREIRMIEQESKENPNGY